MAARNDQVKSQYGGMHFSTSFFGWLVAAAISVLLGSLVTAIGLTAWTQTDGGVVNNAEAVGIVGVVTLLIVLAVAYYAGGYVAGRMARFDGARQGVGVWLMGLVATIILAIAGGVLGASFNLLDQSNIPRLPFDSGTLSLSGLISWLVVAAATLLAAVWGGARGAAYHDAVDTTVSRLDQQRAEDNYAENETVVERPTAGRYAPTFGERIEAERAKRRNRR